jgi:hypothetical protein
VTNFLAKTAEENVKNNLKEPILGFNQKQDEMMPMDDAIIENRRGILEFCDAYKRTRPLDLFTPDAPIKLTGKITISQYLHFL